MAEIYNLGIGLSVVGATEARGAIDGVIESLTQLERTLGGVGGGPGGGGFDRIAQSVNALGGGSGSSLDQLAASAADSADSLRDIRDIELAELFTDAVDAVKDLSEAFGGVGGPTRELDGGVSGLEDSLQRMSAAVGGGREGLEPLADQLTDLGLASQFSTAENLELAQALAATGQSLGDFTVMGKDAEEGMFGQQDTMIALMGTFGIAADEVASFAKATQRMGVDITQLSGNVAMFQKEFGMPGLIQELPGVVKEAETSFEDFGHVIGASTEDITKNVLSTGAAIAKGFGVTAAEGIQKAQALMQGFGEMGRSTRDVMLGLADDFDPLTNALLENGVSWQSVEKIQKQATTGPGGMLSAVDSIKQMAKGMDSVSAEKMIRQLQMANPELGELLVNEEKLAAARKAQAEANRIRADQEKNNAAGGKAAQEAFKNMAGEMLNTTKAFKEMFNNVIDLGKSLIGLMVADDAKTVFEGLTGTMTRLTAKLREGVAWVRENKEELEPIRKIVRGVATAVLGLTGVFGGLAAAAAPLYTVRTAFDKIRGIVGKSQGTVGKFGKIFGKLGGIFKGVTKFAGKAIFKIFGPAMALVETVRTIGRAFQDPNLTSGEKFNAIFGGILAGLDTFLLGLPSLIIGKFMPDFGAQMDEGFETIDWLGMMKTVGGKLVDGLKTAGLMLVEKVSQWDTMLLKALPDLKQKAIEWGGDLGRGLGVAARMAVDLIKGYIFDVWWPTIKLLFSPSEWGSIMDSGLAGAVDAGPGSSSSQFATSLLGILQSSGDMLLTGIGSVIDGFLNAMGTSVDELGIELKLLWSETKEFFHLGALKIGDAILAVWDSIRVGWAKTTYFLKEAWSLVQFGIDKGVGVLRNTVTNFIASFKKGWEVLTSGLTVALLSFVKKSAETLRDFIAPILAAAKAVGKVLGIDTSALDSAKKGLDGIVDKVDSLKKAEQEASNRRLAAIETERKKRLVSDNAAAIAYNKRLVANATQLSQTLQGVAAEKKAREEGNARIKKGYDDEQEALSRQATAVAQVRVEEEKRHKAAKKARQKAKEERKAEISHTEKALKSLTAGQSDQIVNALVGAGQSKEQIAALGSSSPEKILDGLRKIANEQTTRSSQEDFLKGLPPSLQKAVLNQGLELKPRVVPPPTPGATQRKTAVPAEVSGRATTAPAGGAAPAPAPARPQRHEMTVNVRVKGRELHKVITTENSRMTMTMGE